MLFVTLILIVIGYIVALCTIDKSAVKNIFNSHKELKYLHYSSNKIFIVKILIHMIYLYQDNLYNSSLVYYFSQKDRAWHCLN
ncbi:hypothetical protein A6J39_008050 [Legionella anisa]|uniref:Uncharacterized protein n=1 Tax=Legionella anisa TaxID=28082 RepID=A0AAX0WSS3_9GAMM|nr:hypothetical protein DLD14_14080 [Legionella anisa]PNL61170.1 hypothetical protein A6J39_008050 [Legionella anisa]